MIDSETSWINAHDPRSVMAPDHVNPREAVKAFLELRAKHLLIVYWGSFRLGYTPVHFPPLELQREAEKAGIEDRTARLTHGQTVFYDKDRGRNKFPIVLVLLDAP